MMPKKFDAYAAPIIGITFTMPSKTNPDEAVARKNLMDRIGNGPQVGNRMRQHDGEDHIPDISRMDYAEFFQFYDRVSGNISDALEKKELAKVETARLAAEAAMKKAQEDAVEAYIKSLKNA